MNKLRLRFSEKAPKNVEGIVMSRPRVAAVRAKAKRGIDMAIHPATRFQLSPYTLKGILCVGIRGV